MSEIDKENTEAIEKIFVGQHEFMLGVAHLKQLPETQMGEIAFAGRSNVGKSSLINALTGRKALARTSKTPGRTQELNFFSIGPGAFILVDMPGYGYAKVSNTKVAEWTKMLKKYLRGRVNLRLACVLVDGRHGLKETDIEMMTMLDESAVPYRIILTKADKVKKSEMDARIASINEVLKKHQAAFPMVHVTSADKRTGLDELQAILLGAAC